MKNQNTLFVTDFQHDSKTQHSEKESDPSVNMTSIESKALLNTKRMSPAKYFKTHTQVFENTKESFLGYIINDQTKFADFNKIESYYKESIVDSITNLNITKKEINDRQKKLERLNHTIDQVLLLYS